MEADGARKVGVTKCNDEIEVTEIRLGMLILRFSCFCLDLKLT